MDYCKQKQLVETQTPDAENYSLEIQTQKNCQMAALCQMVNDSLNHSHQERTSLQNFLRLKSIESIDDLLNHASPKYRFIESCEPIVY